MEQGWVKLYRKIDKNDFLMTDNNAYVVFTKLMIFADKDTGCYRTGQRALAELVNLPYGTTYKALHRLEANGLLRIEPLTKFSKIWITNWTVYQSNREIDSILEHNVPLGKRNSVKLSTKVPKKEADKEAVNNREKIIDGEALGESRGKRVGSAREDYNKNKEIEYTSTNVLVDESSKVYGKPEINELFLYWEQRIGLPIKSKVQKNRNAAYVLHRQYGMDKLKQLIDGVSVSHSDQFAPMISDFCSLQAKVSELIIWGKKRKQSANSKRKVAYV